MADQINSTDRRAQALAEVATMQADLIEANLKIDSLEKQLARGQDMIAILADERKIYRSEALLFRSKLIELATSMSNIGLLTLKAQEIMATALAIDGPETAEQAAKEQQQAAAIVSNLPAGIAADAETAVEAALGNR